MIDKTESSVPEGAEQSRPFFARFLEGQDSSKSPIRTLKFPSDSDEDGNYMPANYGPRQ